MSTRSQSTAGSLGAQRLKSTFVSFLLLSGIVLTLATTPLQGPDALRKSTSPRKAAWKRADKRDKLELHPTGIQSNSTEAAAVAAKPRGTYLQELVQDQEHARARQHPEGASGGRHLKINVSDSSLQRRPNITDIVVKSAEQEVKAAEIPKAGSTAAAGGSPDQVAMLLKLREILDKAGPQSNDTAVVLGKLQEVLVEAKASQAKAEAHRHAIEAAARPPRSGVLDLVITHYNPDNAQQVNDFWVGFLKTPKIQAMKPYVYLFCQNEGYDKAEEAFKPMLQFGGQVIHTANIGRESHGYLQHIIEHYNDLAQHTLFAQDVSNPELLGRMDMLFENRTGYLPLSYVGTQYCSDPWLPNGIMSQIYSMFAQDICPPVGYTSGFQGQFIVSKQRIRERPQWMYQKLQDFLSAEEGHWIHDTHPHCNHKIKSDPMFGHVLERTWSLAFNCFESWRDGNCAACLRDGMKDCGDGACQCFDRS